MRVSLPTRRPPDLLEQVLGRRRAKVLRRRFGFLALGVGYSLVKPRSKVVPLIIVVCTCALVVRAVGLR